MVPLPGVIPSLRAVYLFRDPGNQNLFPVTGRWLGAAVSQA